MAGVGQLIQVERPPTYNEYDLINRLTDLYLVAKDARGSFVEEWKRHYRITMNRSAPAVGAAQGIRANEVFATVDSRIAWMTDQQIQFSLTPACDPFNMYSIAVQTLGEQLESVINSVMRTDGWDADISEMLWDSNMYGAGFGKVVWDQGMLSGMGNVAFKHVSPWCLYPDPFATDLDDMQYIFEVATLVATEIERRFPDVPPDIIEDVITTGDDTRDHIAPNQNTSRTRQGALIPVDAGQGATMFGAPGNARYHTYAHDRGVNVYTCWVRENFEEWIRPADPSLGDEPRRTIVDQWRVIVYAGRHVLIDELAENLFHTDRHPYFRHVDVETGEFWGSAILRDLAPCQQAMNTLLAMGQNNVIYTGNPVLIAVKNSGADRSTWLNRPGQIYDVNSTGGQAQQNKPDWLKPPELPQSLMALVALWREEMERIAGLSATQKGEVPSGRATDRQVQAGQEAGFVRIRSAIRNLERCLAKAGELAANLIIINYDTSRFVAIVGDQGESTSMRLAAQHFYSPVQDVDGKVSFEPMRFAMTCGAGSSKPTSRGARIQEAIQLKQLNVVDDEFVLEAFQVPHRQAVLQRKQQQQQMQLMLAQSQAQSGTARRSPQPRPASSAPRPA